MGRAWDKELQPIGDCATLNLCGLRIVPEPTVIKMNILKQQYRNKKKGLILQSLNFKINSVEIGVAKW